MQKKITKVLETLFFAALAVLILALVLPNSFFRKYNAVLGFSESAKLRQQTVDPALRNDAENEYIKTKAFLVSLSVSEEAVSKYNDSQLDYFARSNSVAALSTECQELDPKISLIIAMHDNGRMRIYADVEWSKLPKELYTDFLSINGLPQILTLYENESLAISFNGKENILSPESDYELYLKDVGQVGVKFEFGKILNELGGDDKNVKLHFEIDVVKASPTEYSCFNVSVLYQHLTSKHDGVTVINNFDTKLGFEFNKHSRVHLTYYILSPDCPISYYPKGFTP